MGAPPRIWLLRLVGAAASAGVIAAMLHQAESWPVRLALLVAAGAAAALGAWRFLPGFDPFGRVRRRLPRGLAGTAGPRFCAVTFDDGPTPSTGAALDVLAREGVAATFFVLGEHAARHPDIVRRMHRDGHAVGVHGLTHRKLHGADEAEVERQVAGAMDVLRGLGVPPAPVYRTPHGFKSPSIFSVARRHGLTVWAWTRGVWDTDRPAPAALVRRATRFARPGMVLLLHDGRGDALEPDISSMLHALPDILRTLKGRGFTFVRLSDV